MLFFVLARSKYLPTECRCLHNEIIDLFLLALVLFLTDDHHCGGIIVLMLDMAKAAFNKKKNVFTSKLDLNLRKKLVKCYIWSIALYGAETWTIRAVDQKHL